MLYYKFTKMKKLLILLAFSPILAFSQGETNFGLKGGLAFTSYSGDNWTNSIAPSSVSLLNITGHTVSNKSSFTGALAVNSKISDFFWLKHEFWYIQRGTTVTGDQLDDNYTYTRHYIDLAPVLFTFNFKGFQVFGGPQAGVMMFKKDEYTIGSTTTKYEDSTDDTILDYGAVFGAEYEFPFGLNIGARVFKGFNKLNPNNDQSWFNNTTVITTGWTFGASE